MLYLHIIYAEVAFRDLSTLPNNRKVLICAAAGLGYPDLKFTPEAYNIRNI